MPWLADEFGVHVGWSDHTLGNEVVFASIALGACVIEKHFTINPKLRESDNPFSVTPEELREIVFRVRQVEEYMGSGEISKIETEEYMWSFRRHSA